MEFNQSKLIKYHKATRILLGALALFINTLLLDRFVLPTKETPDRIFSYISFSNSTNTYTGTNKYYKGYKFLTDKGFEFSTENAAISNPRITITHTFLFKNVIGVYSDDNDYSQHLVSSVNGFMLYLYAMLGISSLISFCFLQFSKKLTVNGFYNAILINAMIIFWILWLTWKT
ncbi:hypothetical protein [Flavobacterium sp.]|uniref:hypothetical protein n=1 Tax=Flavobacterium sp. TaxID=239 RepID=UPI002639AEFD|nr:hypothetical protein [Flavobacterium sp.]